MRLVTQFFPPKPSFTDKSLPNLKGKVYIVTGANTGIGKEVARGLYANNAKVYIFARSEDKTNKAIQDIKNAHPSSSGALAFIHLDLNDLATIKPSARKFLAQEDRIDALFNNAGVMASIDSKSLKTVQGHEQHLGINCLGTFLFTKLLTPTLVATAKTAPANSVRVIWVSSVAAEVYSEKHKAFEMENLDYHVDKPILHKYGVSKAGSWAYGVEFAKRYKADGVVSLPLNPGNLRSDLFRSQGHAFKLMNSLILYPVPNGAATQLFAAFSPQITLEESGTWVIPFGRLATIRKDLLDATKTEEEGGNGGTHKFWEWSEEQIRDYA